jgi:hypothetical protein
MLSTMRPRGRRGSSQAWPVRLVGRALALGLCVIVWYWAASIYRHQLHSKGEVLPDPAIVEHQKKAGEWPVWWFSPFFDGSSFGQEAATLVLGMMRWIGRRNAQIHASMQACELLQPACMQIQGHPPGPAVAGNHSGTLQIRYRRGHAAAGFHRARCSRQEVRFSWHIA